MTVRQFRKRPVVVQAIQWTGENLAEAVAFLGADFAGTRGDVLLIRTLENPDSPFQARPGWWLVQGVAGEHHAVEPRIFARTYAAARRRWLPRVRFDVGAVGCAVAGAAVAQVVQDFTGSAGWGDVAGLPVVVVGVFGLFWWRRRGGSRG